MCCVLLCAHLNVPQDERESTIELDRLAPDKDVREVSLDSLAYRSALSYQIRLSRGDLADDAFVDKVVNIMKSNSAEVRKKYESVSVEDSATPNI